MNETEETKRDRAAATPGLTLPIVIGRKYVRRDGVVVEAREKHPDMDSGCAYVGQENEAECRGLEHVWINSGRIHNLGKRDFLDLVADYVEAPAVPDGFTPWIGGEQPAETRGKQVHVILRYGNRMLKDAADLLWIHNGERGDIIAYKLADEQPAPATAPSTQPEHSHAQVLRWIADGHGLQWRRADGQLVPISHEEALYVIARHSGLDEYAPDRFRLAPPKPRMIVVNGIKVPAGEMSAPAHGTECFIADPVCADWVSIIRWLGIKSQVAALARGLLYTDRVACEQRAKAMAATQEAA